MKSVTSFTEKNSGFADKSQVPCQEEYAKINGIRQYLLHYPAGPKAPVFLHIHGGPGAPASLFAYQVEAFPRNYSIVYYDQRGAGKTLLKNPFAKLNMKLLQQDLLETVLYIKRKYGKKKIGLIGHSWGSVLGSAFAMEHPQHLSCYIGSGQMYCFRENETRAYGFLQKAVLRSGAPKAKRALKRLEGYPAEQCSLSALLDVTRMRALQGQFGLAMSMDAKAKRILRRSPVAGALDLPAFVLGGMRSAALMKEFWNYDLRDLGSSYQMPVYYVLGDRDRTTPFEIAREYFDRIEAPAKQWHFVPDAGHFAMLDHTSAWQDIMRGIAEESALWGG